MTGCKNVCARRNMWQYYLIKYLEKKINKIYSNRYMCGFRFFFSIIRVLIMLICFGQRMFWHSFNDSDERLQKHLCGFNLRGECGGRWNAWSYLRFDLLGRIIYYFLLTFSEFRLLIQYIGYCRYLLSCPVHSYKKKQ